MVYISKVYTKSGDDGGTMLANGERVSKSAPRIRSYGDIDELNAVIGWVRVELGREPAHAELESFRAALDPQLGRIQQELFNLGAELATPEAVDGGARLILEARHTERLEADIDGWNEALAPLRSFILPGGGPTAVACHLARTVCRRAERDLVALREHEPVRPESVRYVNRLSDYFFVVSRAASHVLGYPEALWDPASV